MNSICTKGCDLIMLSQRSLLGVMFLMAVTSQLRAMESDSPRAGFISPAAIVAAQERLAQGDETTTATWDALLAYATESLEAAPQAVADYAVPGFYGDQRDEHRRMKVVLSDDSGAAYACAVVARVGHNLSDSERSRYAEHAAAILRAWATTNERVSEADGKLVMCYNGTALVVAASMLRGTSAWSDADDAAMQLWTERVLLNAASIQKRKNNWAAWGIFAAIVGHAYRDDAAALDAAARRLRVIIDEQIEPDGAMPHEIGRGKRGIWYTYFAIAPITAAAEALRVAGGEDLYRYEPPSGGTIADALEYLFVNGLVNRDQWPVEQARSDEPDWSSKHGALYTAMGLLLIVKIGRRPHRLHRFDCQAAWRG